MTFSEMQTEVYGLLGQFSMLNPSTDTQNRIKNWINTGYRKVLLWKMPDGRQLRFRCTEGELFFRTSQVTGTAEDGSTTSITLETGAVSGVDDYYNGWVIYIDSGTGSGQYRYLVDYSGGTRVATVHESWDTTPDSTSTYQLFRRFLKFASSGSDDIIVNPVSSIYDVLKVTDLVDGKDLSPALRTSNWPDVLANEDTPSQYITYGDRLMFNCAINEQRWYRMEYFRMPPALSADADTPEIPELWHEAIMLWARWKGLAYTQETGAAYAAKNDLVDFIATTIEQESTSAEREESWVTVSEGANE